MSYCVYPNARAPPNRCAPPFLGPRIMIASDISPIMAHDDASFIRFSRYIQCFRMVIDSKH